MISLSQDTNEAKLGDEAPKIRRLSDIVQSTHETYEHNVEKRIRTAPYAQQPTSIRLLKGFEDNMRQILYTPEGIEIMYGQAKMAVGGLLEDEKLVERGRSLIQSANNEITQSEIEADRTGFSFSPEDYKSFSYALGGGAANYGVMLAAAYATGGLTKAFKASQKAVEVATEASGLSSNFLLEAVGNNQASLDRYKQETGDYELKNYNTAEGKKALSKALIYGTGSTILEKYMGFGQQRKMFAKPREILTQTAKVAASEGTTEFSQSLLDMGINLATGDISWNDMPEELRQAFMEGAVGAVLGGGAGIATGLSQRANVKNMIKDRIKGTVSDEKIDIIADEIYEDGNAELSNVIAKELKYDTELRNKRGDVYNSMVKAVSKAMDKSGGYTGLTEEQKAQHATEVANMFADQALAEANKRGVLITDVIDAKDIVSENGKIYLKGITAEQKKVKKVINKVEKAIEEKTETKEQEVAEPKEEIKESEEKQDSLSEMVSDAVEETGVLEETTPSEKIEDYGEKLEGAKKDLEYNIAKKQTGNNSIERVMSKVGDNISERIYIANWLREQDPEFVDNLAKYNHKLITVRTNAYKEQLSNLFKEHGNELGIGATERLDILYGGQDPSREILKKYGITPEREVFLEEGKRYIVKATPEYVAKKLGDRGKISFQYNRSTRGGYYLWVKKGSGGWHVLERFGSKEEMEEHKNSHTEEQLNELLKEKTDVTPKEKPIRKREGKNYRNGKNVTAKDFTDTFGFRGVQFGNYENNEKRQRELNNAYDSLMDLADILNIPPKAISLNGQLGIAFGARGSGSAAAHYEPMGKIINITRDSGAGAIGHEWFHALDNYLAGGEKFATGGQRDALRMELRKKLVSFLTAIEMENDYQSRLALLGQYWKRKWEIGARAFELYLSNKMNEKGIVNDYLAQDRSDETPYLNSEEQNRVLPKLNEFFDTLQTRETEKGVELYQSAYVSMKGELEGEFLDADRFEFTGEGQMIHGWGNYALKDRKTNKIRYYDWMSGNKILYNGQEIDSDVDGAIKLAAEEFIFNGKNVEETKKAIRGKIKSAEYDIKKEEKYINDLAEGYGVSKNEIKLLREYKDLGDSFRELMLIDRNGAIKKDKELREKLSYNALEHSAYFNVAFDNLDTVKRHLNEAKKALNVDLSKIKVEKTGAQYEIDVPEDEFLLDEDLTFKNQSKFVQERIKKLVNDENLNRIFEIYQSEERPIYNTLENEDGRSIYKALEHVFDSKKLASKLLEKYGIKGIKYNGHTDGIGYVIFKGADAPIVRRLLQGGKVKRGSYNENSKVIKLFKDANTSTLPHELAHYWLDNMYSYVKSGAASVDYLNQFQAVKDFLGIKDNQEFLTRQQQEKFASGYEKYIHRGIIPNSIMGNVYDGYERWLRDVYDSIEDIKAQGKLPFKLTSEIIKFFDSMLTGGLGEVASQDIADTARLEEMKEADDAVVKESKQVVEAKPIRPTSELLPVKSEGEERKSRLYERMKDLGDAEDSLGYNEVTIAEQREKARKMWQENPEQAQSILNDVNFSNDILRNALFTEQQARALENGDTDTYLSSLRQQSAEATRMGQELSALRGVFEDVTMPAYWIREAEMEAHKQLAKKMTSYIDRLRGKTSLESLTRQLDEDIDSLTKAMLSSDNKVKTLSEGINELKKKYKGLEQRDVELFQEEFTNEAEARKYVEKKAKEAIGLNLTDEQANNIIQMASNLDKMSDKFDKFGVPSEKYFAEKAKLEKAVNEHTPTSQVKVLISTIGRANMLTAPATSVLNVVSNLENYAIQKSLRYINNNITNHTNDNIVDSELAKEYRDKLWQTFWNTGYDVSIMRSLTDTKLYKGESITHSEGDGAIRQIGRFAEKYVFSRLISSPDIYFKSIKGFTDYVGNEATDIAYKEGLTGEKAKNRANDLFLDATRIEPQTEEGKLIRQKAQIEAAVITYQQDTELSKNLLKLRDLINKCTGDIGIGDILSPFVKTPANILSMGYDATVGAFGHPKNLIQAINDLRSGNLQSDALQTTIRQTTNQVLSGVLIAVILSALIDDDDYIPDYSQLSQSERNAIREAGGTFGSVKIGNTYISTDFFGPLEMPLVAWLNARREKGLTERASAFGGAVIREFLDAPVIRDTISSSKSLENIGAGHLELEEALYDYLGDTISSRLTPNVLNILAKITDDYERKAGKSITDKLKARIPYLRQELPAQVSMATGRPVETQPAWLQILFGARAKEERNSPLAKEFRRLSQTGNGASISDPTKYGDLRTLPDELKIKVLKDFSEQYSKEANKTIKLASYKKAGDEEKKNMLDKLRRKTTKDIKQKYKKYLKKNKQ